MLDTIFNIPKQYILYVLERVMKNTNSMKLTGKIVRNCNGYTSQTAVA